MKKCLSVLPTSFHNPSKKPGGCHSWLPMVMWCDFEQKALTQPVFVLGKPPHTLSKSLKWNLLWDILALELSVAWSHGAKRKTLGSWCKAFLVVDLPEEGGNSSVGVCESIHCSDTLEWLMPVLLAHSVWTNKGDVKASLCCNNIAESLCEKD